MGKTLFSFCLLLSLCANSSAQTCSSYSFSSNKLFSLCTTLPYLNAFLHWNYHPSNGTVDIAYRHASIDASKWVAWALNLEGTGMAGCQSLVALHSTNGTTSAYTSSVNSTAISSLAQSKLSFDVPSISAEYANSEMIIYATLVLPGNQTTFNQVWQDGPVSNGNAGAHALSGANVQSMGKVNFLSGETSSTGVSKKDKNVHGVLNAVAWGTLMPIGAIIARYLKVFKSADPAWFYLHVACQSSAYIVGVAGWGTGLKLGSDSPGVTYTAHRNIGITLFCFGTLQVFALLLRPNKDNKYRMYWNFYHWGIGYLTIILSVINIFKGFDILDPEDKWKNAYIGIIVALGCIAVILEVFSWFVVLKRKKTQKHPQNGANGANGYGARSQP